MDRQLWLELKEGAGVKNEGAGFFLLLSMSAYASKRISALLFLISAGPPQKLSHCCTPCAGCFIKKPLKFIECV